VSEGESSRAEEEEEEEEDDREDDPMAGSCGTADWVGRSSLSSSW
jgi:hypothetical protein